MPQTWRLSQDANIHPVVCTVCFATRQLRHREGTVHRHGPRDGPCPGSNKLPLGASVVQDFPAPTDASGAAVTSGHESVLCLTPGLSSETGCG